MKTYYHPDTDSVAIHLKDGVEGVVGEIMGEDLNENVVLHRDAVGTLYEIEVVGSASKVFDLSRLKIKGMPINASQETYQESKAG